MHWQWARQLEDLHPNQSPLPHEFTSLSVSRFAKLLLEKCTDLGLVRQLSGSKTERRHGFARLAHDVADGQGGAVLAIEASRLSRSSEDWQRLLSLCAVAQVLVIDEQTIYDPSDHVNKLLLNIKGAMPEQELHWLSLRMAGGRLNEARRGESYIHPPTGYVWRGLASNRFDWGA